ncbi:acyl-CoA dehydrogenase/oxidase [Chytriomyces cf. hyalinus JEL632]|nr:acyl-CoA dehydrogenase/oxidase [Chytriomyces cf. hyalinus JEL632]
MTKPDDSVFLKLSPKVQDMYKKLSDFVDFECIPAEHLYHQQLAPMGHPDRWNIVPPVIEQLKTRAKEIGVWNCFLPATYGKYSPGLTNLEYAVLCELMGRSHLAPEATNCGAPDTGNMEVFAKYGNQAQKDKWLVPLMNGSIRSAFAMTEPAVASSDATNIETSIVRDEKNKQYVINGRKWWISGAGDPRCKVYLVMGKTDFGAKKHLQQSVVIVPAGTPGVTIVRPMMVFGYDDAAHGHMEMLFKDCRVPFENMVLGEGRGFEIVQGRLGPGRIHHCMRAIGLAERALELHILRITDPSRKPFGKMIAQHNPVPIVNSRLELDQARLLVLMAADKIDAAGPKAALKEIGMAKIVVPRMALAVFDRAIQAYGAAGVSQDTPLAYMYAMMRTLRIADGPDEVHERQVAMYELKKSAELRSRFEKQKDIEASLLAKL